MTVTDSEIELKRFLEDLEEKQVDIVRVMWSDLHGVARGKDIALEDFGRDGIAFCQTLLHTDLAAHPRASSDPAEIGYPDTRAVADLSTARVTPFSSGVAVVLADLEDPLTGRPLPESPRDLLRRVVGDLIAEVGHPVVGPELEFYLAHRDNVGALRPYVNRDTAGYVVGAANDDLASRDVLLGLLRQCRAMGLGVFAANHEFSGGQFEVNHHHSDALDAADRAFLFKYAVKEIAAVVGLHATFMGQPFNDKAGNGFHLHVSLVDELGVNLFDEPAAEHGLSELALHFLGGVLEHAPALTALLNPTVNSFRRLHQGGLVASIANWGLDNRFAFARVPRDRGRGTRFEVRSGDGAANPYLAVAALLAAGHDGVRRSLTPPPPAEGRHPGQGAVLPRNLEEALDHLTADAPLVTALGETFVDAFTGLKRQELARYERHVSDWDIREYSWML
ncbi:glutamine synthetase [Lentzea sp. NBRC 105346]|uniref:glutamine synthetase family protein n=1 Tax=Lentzea sp. NBRC 105346 TaxID=3032205 RepID=UPI0024A09DA9|nr:glutamine synthetase family protein [Lentzea sp. NBRC 105346]GLZ29280.1 glutamine synthetase [Lentzea sp. NBRC 105346]